jgi:hypothetical protein
MIPFLAPLPSHHTYFMLFRNMCPLYCALFCVKRREEYHDIVDPECSSYSVNNNLFVDRVIPWISEIFKLERWFFADFFLSLESRQLWHECSSVPQYSWFLAIQSHIKQVICVLTHVNLMCPVYAEMLVIPKYWHSVLPTCSLPAWLIP